MEEPFVDPEGEIASFCDSTGNYLPLLCVSNLANGFDEFCRINDISHHQFDELIDQTEPGNNGRVLIPWYEGERTPDIPNATPLYFGFTLEDFNQKTLSRSILEGHLLNLYSGFESLPVVPKQILLTGGLSQSPAWCQTIADIFSTETTPLTGEGAALGAAIHACWVWQKESGENITINEVCDDFITYNHNLIKTPRPEYKNTYDKLKILYQSLSSRIQGLEGDNPFNLYSALKI
jgi:sugar (pentulose or hexulose) kinase